MIDNNWWKNITSIKLEMSWKFPNSWQYKSNLPLASHEEIHMIMFSGRKRWNKYRSMWLRRDIATGQIIWPWEMAWRGVVASTISYELEGGSAPVRARIVWLKDSQFLIEKIKGNI